LRANPLIPFRDFSRPEIGRGHLFDVANRRIHELGSRPSLGLLNALVICRQPQAQFVMLSSLPPHWFAD
jgi:hypothetical protein